MTNYPRSAYGTSNPNAGYPANGDVVAWGGHCYPKGVPTGLLGTTNYKNLTTNGQTLRVTMRKELVPLWNGIFQLCDLKYHYPIWAQGPSDGKPWGPWGYSNRAISGTQRPSGHSSALSVDINAPYNPYSYTFQSDMPPAMVADLESLGQYWGGRYSGQKYDAMHYGFCRKPSTVGGYIARLNTLLAAVGGNPKPPTPEPEPDMPLTDADFARIEKIVDAQVAAHLKNDILLRPDNYQAVLGKPSEIISLTEIQFRQRALQLLTLLSDRPV